jgi:hypothetical protein
VLLHNFRLQPTRNFRLLVFRYIIFYRFSHIMTDGPGPTPTQSSHPFGTPFRGMLESTTQQTNSPSENEPSTQRANSSPEDEPPGQDERQALRTKLSSFISEFRDRKLSKARVISRISTLIDDDATLPDSEKEKAIDLYFEELNSIDFGREPEFFPSGPEKDKAVDDSVHEILSQVANQTKFRDDFREDSDDPDEPPRKKKKAKESDMGWYNPNEPSSFSENDSSRKTCKRLQTYNEDISGAKFLVKLNRNAPAGIPSSQWERVLRGETLDLDHFLSSLHRTSVTEEGETRIGNAKISIGVSDAKRRVSTASEWSSAWHLASRAVAFAFPHRAEELRDYGDIIEGEFASKITSSHPRIILFDIAIRNIVQGGHSTLLTDKSLYLRFYSSILMPDGVVSNLSAGANRRSIQPRASGSRSDVCNRFNTSNGCPSSESECKYRHICKKCKKGGHGRDQCPK